jgi:thiamine biosynthesis lipoprotein
MSTWRKNSELSKFNAFKKKTWFKVSHATANTVKKALKIGDLTHGAFDVTIGKVVNLWGFGPTKKPVKVPPKKVLQEALASNGYKKIEVRLTPPSLRKSNPNLYVDLSGIAKGYGVDIVAEHLESVSIHSYMVEIGGEMRLKGEKPGKQAWKIAIERPQVGTRAIHQILSPRNHGLATSGDYRNFFEDKGQRYSHLIDPRNGYPIKHRLVSVTVIADTSLEADAFATAFMVLGLNEGLAIAKKQKMAVMFLVRDGESFKDIHTTQFTQYMVK